MARPKKEQPYEQKAVTAKITASSRISLKIKDSYYTVEYSEERIIPDVAGVNLEKEKELLWDTVNTECDNQALEIRNTFSR